MTSFTDMLDEYLDAKATLDAARAMPGSGYGGDPYIGEDPLKAEKARHGAATARLNGLVERLLRAEQSVRTRDQVQPLPTGFP